MSSSRPARPYALSMALRAKVSGRSPDLCSCAITSSHLDTLPALACADRSSMCDFIVGRMPTCFSSWNAASASEQSQKRHKIQCLFGFTSKIKEAVHESEQMKLVELLQTGSRCE